MTYPTWRDRLVMLALTPLWLLLALCGGCVSAPIVPGPPPTPPPVAAPTRTFDLSVCAGLTPGVDGQGQPNTNCAPPLSNVVVTINTHVSPADSHRETTNGDGYTLWALPDPTGDASIYIDAPDYRPYDSGTVHLVDYAARGHNFIVLQPAHVDPSTFTDAQIRAIKTDLAGVYITEIKPQCPVDPHTGIACVADNGATPHGLVDGILFTANYRIYTAAQRQIIRDVFTGKRPDAFGLIHHYTHFAISLFCGGDPDYHGVYPACVTSAKVSLNDALHELWDDHLIPIGFAMQDAEPNDLTTPLSIAGVVDPSLVRIVSPYWEHYEVDCAMQKVRALFPLARLYYHNPTNTDAGYPNACYNPPGAYSGEEWWRHARDVYGVIGGLIQNDQGSVQDTVNRLADFASRFTGGYHGWPTGLDSVWFEDTNTVYDNFWSGGNEVDNLQRADQVLAAPLCIDGVCGTLAGYGSGGRR